MTSALVLSALIVASQSITSTPGPEPVVIEQREVAYEALSNGRSAEAVVTLEARLREDPQDPATLINLGTAYARQGETVRAQQAFNAAMTSDTLYRLELADGSWVDSRQAARRALRSLETRYPLAALTR
jgi:Tfp pilus assembly protein PilF